MLTQCVGCGRERKTHNRVNFGLNVGGLLCQNCRAGQTNVVSVSPEGINLLLALTAQHQATATEGLESELWRVNEMTEKYGQSAPTDLPVQPWVSPPEPTGEVRKLIQKYITHLLGFPPRMHRFLDRY